ncbi:hypothetical protein PVAP13_3NG221015 [Panicum virgatum]|uniref:Uncharacterized protein n=1 Tax=Panicum virgatum TaxID=38727 RepID=A0A8T0U8Y3_PANVG|nr:hypothetical protein PVAP13_3NG221015 [Panicum virgatum]
MFCFRSQHTLHKKTRKIRHCSYGINCLTLIFLRICNNVSCKNQIILNITSTYISITIRCSDESTSTWTILHDMSHSLAAVAHDVCRSTRRTFFHSSILLVLLGLHSRHIDYLRSWRGSWWCCWWLSNRRLGLLNVGTLLKRSPSVGPERILDNAASLYFPFCLKSKMIQLGKMSLVFVIKNILYITI